jgi:glycine cleavage system H protein
MTNPENLSYTKEHEWVRQEDGVATVGITAFAAESLGDVVFVQLPSVGDTVTAGEVCGEIESTKSVSELYAPATGEVLEVNEAAADTPEVINADPFGEGWLFKLRPESLPDLLNAESYTALTKEG